MRPMKSALLAGAAILVGTVPAMATDSATEKQKQQYLYDQTLKNEGAAAGQAPALIPARASRARLIRARVRRREHPAVRLPTLTLAHRALVPRLAKLAALEIRRHQVRTRAAYRVPRYTDRPLYARAAITVRLNLALRSRAPARPALFLLVLRIGAARS